MGQSLKYLFSIFFICVFAACSTKKNTFFTRAFHNTTTHYNWYFNGEEVLKKSIKKLAEKHQEDYNQLLPIFPIGTEKDAQSITPSLDQAIKKGAKAISRHSIFIKGEEYNKWVDDCYLMIAKSYFFQREYVKAIEAFRFISRQFKGTEIDFEAQLWLCRSYIDLGDLSSAELLFNTILTDDNFPKKLHKDFALTYAHYHIKKQDFSSASEELLVAIEETANSKEKSRYHFILSQIYHQQENYKEATKHYEIVLKKSPDYEMAFNAKINRARAYDVASGNIESVREELQKMLKDDKNIEYQDVIYYGLAELSVRENKIEEAIPLYKKSVSKSVTNNAQKAISSLQLGKIFYERQHYRMAQLYYDTTIVFLDINHPSYKPALQKQSTLSALIYNLDVINHQDSLQMVAMMSENERNNFIDAIIRKLEEQERLERDLEANNRAESMFLNDQSGRGGITNNRFNQSNQTQSGKWYFYNSTTLSFGYSEFVRKWGKRKLEDDWRRGNKATLSIEAMDSDTIIEDVFDPKNRASYIKGLPLSTAEIQESNNQIIEAHYNAGVIYKEELEDQLRSEEIFDLLNQRFPKNNNRVMVLYYLYILNKELGFHQKSENYKQALLKEYPNSEYSKIISNPDFLQEALANKSEIELTYEQAYNLYASKKYKQALEICLKTSENNPSNLLKPHFDLLAALCAGYISGEQELTVGLEKVKNTYTGHTVSVSAEELLTHLNTNTKTFNQPSTKSPIEPQESEEKEVRYVFKNNTPHYFVILFKDFDLDLNTAKATFSNYHAEYYSLEKLNISSILLDEQTHMISIREFEGASSAMEYYNAFLIADARGPFGSDFDAFVIAAPNFPIFFKNKDIKGYQKKFNEMYLRGLQPVD
tara:strand:+ start:3933 stop:6563 length:2631 start_codon:yes stop_codon:yes gene_type:complete